MQLNKKTLFTSILCLTISLFVGAIGAFLIINNTVKDTILSSNFQYMQEWEAKTYQAYKKEDSKTAIWALNNLIDILKRYKKVYPHNKVIQTDLLLSYARLAKLYRAQGDNVAYRKSVSKALHIAREQDNNIKSEKDLLNFLEKIDEIKSIK
ncbi:MAG TPA: hypothetical protein ENL06_02240 [Candidatus Portnoybacteria bacterium]|nr:hypothetical protein [Candidatus Portnoybacteria bacterium]